MSAVARTPLDLDQRPILVFWETTRACSLACHQCRASAISQPLPGELTTAQAARFVDSLTGFGMPRPVLIATGGDVLLRHDLDATIERARALKVPVALAPSVTPLLTDARIVELRRGGVKVVSISLDGATPGTHDDIRGVAGHFAETVTAIRRLREAGLTVQVNTVAMRDTVEELPAIARIVKESGASIWEVFFLIRVGRGRALGELTAEENEDVCHFLVDAARYGFVVRTVEAPFFRRVVALRKHHLGEPQVGATHGLGPLYEQLATALRAELGEPTSPLRAHTKGTRDGRGIVFVGHDGEIHPSGFLPLSLGNVKRDDIVHVYRTHPLLRRIRTADFSGRCGRCTFRDLCGGSRARAFAASGDPLAGDPACAFRPA
ncbi:MAG: TIGR04053 family radical SAM/SPASM domain-containing protein [Gaiellaceae bacterium]